MTTEITPADREELKPCPFCGGNKARTIHIRDGRKVACPCGACGKPEFHGPLDRPDAEVRAITAWNTRIAEQRAQAEPVAFGAYRAATQWIAADSWDGYSDCIRVLKLARSLDDFHWSPDEHAAAMQRLYARSGEAAIAHPPQAEAGPTEWRNIETAPYDTPVEVRAGHMIIVARLMRDAAMSGAYNSCDQWQAEYEGEHPPCWTGGACWESNEDDLASMQPEAWRPCCENTPSPPQADNRADEVRALQAEVVRLREILMEARGGVADWTMSYLKRRDLLDRIDAILAGEG